MLSKAWLVVLVVYCSSNCSHGQRDEKFFRNDYSYLEEFEAFYKMHMTKLTWADAKRMCALEGASLFYPDNSKEATALISFWTARYDTPQIFLGLSDILVEGLFETIDGKPISEVYHAWQKGQPDNYYEQDCAYLFKSGQMDDGKCDGKANFICKKSLQSLEWNYLCDMPNLDYTLNKDIGKCYKLHTTPLNWMEAHSVCHTEQSHLAVVNNQMEADYLAALAIASSKERIGGKYLRGLFHLGFHNKLYEGWQTTKGTPLNYVDGWWANYQPETNETEQCGSMFYTGRLTHVDCDTKSFFICQHEVVSSNSTAVLGALEEQNA